MGMRASDATFLRREILPVLAKASHLSPEAADALLALEVRLNGSDENPTGPAAFEFNTWFHTTSGPRGGPRNEDADFDHWHVTIDVDGCEVPYIHGDWWEHGDYAGSVHLILDKRFGLQTDVAECERWLPFLANAMAVSAGRTSHGENSFIRNPHGRSGGGDPPPIVRTLVCTKPGPCDHCAPDCERDEPHVGACMKVVERLI